MVLRILCGILALACLSTGQAADFSDIVRLHVIGDSDSEADQALKMQVKDAVMDVIEPVIYECRDFDEVYEALEGCAGDVLCAARGVDEDKDIQVEVGVFEFDDREYEGEIVPAGKYRAMRVVIGDGNGKNWWGIMFPQAMPIETDEDTVYYSAVVEWIFSLFGRDL